jgi:hypothetical protein
MGFILPLVVGIGLIAEGLEILFGDDDSPPTDPEEEFWRLRTEQR